MEARLVGLGGGFGGDLGVDEVGGKGGGNGDEGQEWV